MVAEKGYPDTTVAEIVERASTSQRTFYEHFKNKEDAIVAALDSGSAQMLAAALPAFRRAPDWPHAVHDTQEAMFCFGAEEPEYARLGAVEMYAAGKRALDQREIVTEGMEGLLAPGYELEPETPPIAAEAIGGALYSLLYDHVNTEGPGDACRTWSRRWSTSPWRRSSRPRRPTRSRSAEPAAAPAKETTWAAMVAAHVARSSVGSVAFPDVLKDAFGVETLQEGFARVAPVRPGAGAGKRTQETVFGDVVGHATDSDPDRDRLVA